MPSFTAAFPFIASLMTSCVQDAPSTIGGFNVAIHGDSNAYGYGGDTDKADPSYAVTTPYTLATCVTSNNIGDPTTRISQARGPVQPFGPGGGPGMGLEISLARYLVNHGASGGLTPHLIKFTWYGRALDDWQAASTFPTIPAAGPNIITQAYAQLDAELAASGKPLSAVVFGGSGNDATSGTLVANYTANLTAYITGMRARYGANVWLFLIKLHANADTGAGGYAANRDAIRTAQVNYAASDPKCTLIPIDDLQLNADNVHWGPNTNLAIGDRVGEAIGNALVAGYTGNRSSGAAPYIQGWEPIAKGGGATIGSAASVTVAPPIYPHKAGDAIYAHVVAGGATSTGVIATPGGWTLVSPSQSTLSGAAVISAVFRKIAAAPGTAPPTFAMPANYTDLAARTVVVRNANVAPEDVSTNSTGASLSVSVPGTTTTGANRLLIEFYGAFLGGGGAHSLAAEAASGVTLTEQYDDDVIPSTNHLGLAMASAPVPAITTYGTTSATYTASYAITGVHTIAVKP